MKKVNKLANIYPIKNQQWYKFENYVMILAHLAKKNFYKEHSFAENSYIIMDNGAFENEEIKDLNELIELVDHLGGEGIDVDEVVIPDDVIDNDKSYNMFLKNIPLIKEHDELNFMVVVHADDYEELKRRICDILRICDTFDLDNIVLGLSKLDKYSRTTEQFRGIITGCPLNIHLLGIKKDYLELLYNYPEIRSCDSSHLVHNIKNGRNTFFKEREEADIKIDLENDEIDNTLIAKALLDDQDKRNKLFK